MFVKIKVKNLCMYACVIIYPSVNITTTRLSKQGRLKAVIFSLETGAKFTTCEHDKKGKL